MATYTSQTGVLAIARRWLRRVAIGVPLLALTIWTVFPLLMTLSISFKSKAGVSTDPGLIPSNPTLDGYRSIIGQQGFQGAFFNSVVVGLGTAALTLLLAVPAAYAFARFRFRGRHLLLLFTLLPRLIPGLGLMVPLYRLAVAVGGIDKISTLILAFTATVLPLAVWLLVGFFQQVPRELEEAANVDGTNMFQRVRYIVLPLAVPALITIGVLAFREAWNEFNLVLGLTSTPGSRTLPYELFLMTQTTGFQDNPGQAAFAVLSIIPFIFVYLRIEKYVVGGITSGAVK
ncbi:MAG: carbohydrate ABC transporter permease [Acidimicrobiia bacterium]|nr:carbohydrate ABC transporter permease [Acidimicrobiia bacterium]MDH5505202.1 carbohydrate ABC transporter permease [Acidimicrobiia bacterium]